MSETGLDFAVSFAVPFFGAALTGGSVFGYASGAIVSLAFSIFVHTHLIWFVFPDEFIVGLEDQRRWKSEHMNTPYSRTWVSAIKNLNPPDLGLGYHPMGIGSKLKSPYVKKWWHFGVKTL